MDKKLCKITQTRKSNGDVLIVARAGKKGTGQEISRSTAWDNGKAIDNSLSAVLHDVRKEGYEPVRWDASGDE